MKVLSLFDGMSCGQIALKELGIIPDTYYASEIDKYAIKTTQHNFPDTIQLGDINKWKEWDIDFKSIDLIFAGSPCQGFSFAGKQLAFDDPRSKLFFVFYDILQHVKNLNPNVKFLLENVFMKEEHEHVITRLVNIKPLKINSALVSAQNRKRNYWTNIGAAPCGLFGDLVCNIPQPEDKGILLKDILDKDVDEKYYLSEKIINGFIKHKEDNLIKGNGFGWSVVNENDKSGTIPTGSTKSSFTFIKVDKQLNPKANQDKASCFTAGGNYGGNHSDMDLIVCAAMRGRNTESETQTEQQIEPRADEKTNCLTSVQKDNLVIMQSCHGKNKGGLFTDKSPTILSNSWEHNNHVLDSRIRRLTPNECKKLQTVPDWYDMTVVSDTQQYRMLGNGWTIDVIKHILSYLKCSLQF